MLVLHGQIQERCDAVGQRDGIVLVAEGHRGFLNAGSLYQSWKICDQFLDSPVESLNFRAMVRRTIEPPGLDKQKRF